MMYPEEFRAHYGETAYNLVVLGLRFAAVLLMVASATAVVVAVVEVLT